LWANGDNRWEPHTQILAKKGKKENKREKELREEEQKRKEREIAATANGYGFRTQPADDIFVAVKDKQAAPHELTQKSGCVCETVYRSLLPGCSNFASGTFTSVFFTALMFSKRQHTWVYVSCVPLFSLSSRSHAGVLRVV